MNPATSALSLYTEEGGHSFQRHSFKSLTWCDHCKDFIWGLANQGYKCKTCGFNSHSKCRKSVTLECGIHRKADKNEVIRTNGHEFSCHTYSSPTWCDNCNNFIWGFQRQGWRCTKCGVNSHGRCVIQFTVPCFISHPAGVGVLQREESINESRERRIISAMDGFHIEDGDFEGNSHSFFSLEKSRQNSSSSINSLSQDEYRFTLFQNPEQDMWFATDFIGKDYDLYLVRSHEAFFLTTIGATSEDNLPIVHVILWLPTGKEQLVIPVPDNELPSIYDILDRAHYILTNKKVQILKVHRKTELYRRVEKHLTLLEASQCSQDFTISVVCQFQNQRTEEAILSNDVLSEECEDFLSIISERIELKGFKDFAGGLDTSAEMTTGRYSYFAKFCKNNIMFHVGPLLPRSTVARPDERRISLGDGTPILKGNMVCVVFMDEKSPRFNPSYLSSKYIHTYACVQSQKKEDGSYRYRVNFTSNGHLPQFGPKLPNPPVFDDPEKFKNFLLAKLVNATKASFMSPTFQARRNQAVSTLLLDYEDVIGSMTYEVPLPKKKAGAK